MRTSFATIAAAVAVTSCMSSSPAAARPTSIRTLAAEEVRLATIAYRIAAANVNDCYRREVITGLVLHDLTRYDRSVRDDISRAFSMAGGFGVLGVVPGSVAADAGLKTDDEIVAVGSFSVDDSNALAAPKSYRRMEQFQALLQTAMEQNSTELLVRRAGNLMRVPIRAQHGCGGQLALTNSSKMNAWSDGKHIIVTTGMVGLSRSDDEIAFVIAHEMAHNVLGHSGKGKGSHGIFGFSQARRGEIEADSYAVRLMSNAGYRPAGGISFLQNARQRLWWNISLDHPGFGTRMKLVAAAMQKASRATIASASPEPKLTTSSLSTPLQVERNVHSGAETVSSAQLQPSLANQPDTLARCNRYAGLTGIGSPLSPLAASAAAPPASASSGNRNGSPKNPLLATAAGATGSAITSAGTAATSSMTGSTGTQSCGRT